MIRGPTDLNGSFWLHDLKQLTGMRNFKTHQIRRPGSCICYSLISFMQHGHTAGFGLRHRRLSCEAVTCRITASAISFFFSVNLRHE
jgi:hypothetical protein